MSLEALVIGLNKLIEMCARSCGCGSYEVIELESDLYNLVNGLTPIEEYWWVEDMLGA